MTTELPSGNNQQENVVSQNTNKNDTSLQRKAFKRCHGKCVQKFCLPIDDLGIYDSCTEKCKGICEQWETVEVHGNKMWSDEPTILFSSDSMLDRFDWVGLNGQNVSCWAWLDHYQNIINTYLGQLKVQITIVWLESLNIRYWYQKIGGELAPISPMGEIIRQRRMQVIF